MAFTNRKKSRLPGGPPKPAPAVPRHHPGRREREIIAKHPDHTWIVDVSDASDVEQSGKGVPVPHSTFSRGMLEFRRRTPKTPYHDEILFAQKDKTLILYLRPAAALGPPPPPPLSCKTPLKDLGLRAACLLQPGSFHKDGAESWAGHRTGSPDNCSRQRIAQPAPARAEVRTALLPGPLVRSVWLEALGGGADKNGIGLSL